MRCRSRGRYHSKAPCPLNSPLTFPSPPPSPAALCGARHLPFTPSPPLLQPYAVHATFQFSGTPGKRNRMREFMLYEDAPEYYDHKTGFVSFQVGAREGGEGERGGGAGDGLGRRRRWLCLPCHSAWAFGPGPGIKLHCGGQPALFTYLNYPYLHASFPHFPPAPPSHPHFQMDGVEALLGNAGPNTGTMVLANVQGHFALVNHQITRVRNALAVATVLGRALVMPQFWCGQDRWWAPHSGE